MKDHQKAFIELAIQYNALKFGEFTLKSGRISPYFFNAGAFNTGEALAKLGEFYATMINEAGLSFDMMFGPAYKGIPLVSSTVSALYAKFGQNYPWSFNRKEAKDHGEGGMIVGSALTGNVLLIDDVMTAGTAIRESIELIEKAGAKPTAVVLMLDREERGKTERSAVQEMRETFGLHVSALITMSDLIQYLEQSGEHAETLANMKAYRAQYGV
ncbi:orotate phosphoribosyltransferase [Wohlfahrtiimonas sp. G9077]|uniref:orotate phosphoribosyltransferase n=1 Tax=Wohlfahrtiimonas sp. G9077 TaxID=1980118 RepID=UPI000B99106C|nr:orotate phosphoribosyltransferase [Wohlfahrtiimonas sp. G9077]OYQ74537.1 orotate phosphoribosyltransferase [Wohlfahrtiimonas sp. G9077]